MDSGKKNVGGSEECNSSESGWTMYLRSSSSSHNHHHHDQEDYYDDSNHVNDDSDDSMASDASSGPSHLINTNRDHFKNAAEERKMVYNPCSVLKKKKVREEEEKNIVFVGKPVATSPATINKVRSKNKNMNMNMNMNNNINMNMWMGKRN